MSQTRTRQVVSTLLLVLSLSATAPLHAARDRDAGSGDTRDRIVRFVQNVLRRVKALDEIVIPRP
jgi:hypothetical protein